MEFPLKTNMTLNKTKRKTNKTKKTASLRCPNKNQGGLGRQGGGQEQGVRLLKAQLLGSRRIRFGSDRIGAVGVAMIPGVGATAFVTPHLVLGKGLVVVHFVFSCRKFQGYHYRNRWIKVGRASHVSRSRRIQGDRLLRTLKEPHRFRKILEAMAWQTSFIFPGTFHFHSDDPESLGKFKRVNTTFCR